MNRNLILTTAFIATSALLASSAMATETRIKSLSGIEKNFTIRDQANINFLPQMLVDHGNQVDVGEAASATSYGKMNIRYKLTDDAVLLLRGVKKQSRDIS